MNLCPISHKQGKKAHEGKEIHDANSSKKQEDFHIDLSDQIAVSRKNVFKGNINCLEQNISKRFIISFVLKFA